MVGATAASHSRSLERTVFKGIRVTGGYADHREESFLSEIFRRLGAVQRARKSRTVASDIGRTAPRDGISAAPVKRHWTVAKLWLHNEIIEDDRNVT